jgi:hypothetical protein
LDALQELTNTRQLTAGRHVCVLAQRSQKQVLDALSTTPARFANERAEWRLNCSGGDRGYSTMMEKNEMGFGWPRAGSLFLLGMGAGVAATLLLAPQSGGVTRRQIGRKVRDGENWVKGKATAAEDYVLTRGTELCDRVKEAASVSRD